MTRRWPGQLLLALVMAAGMGCYYFEMFLPHSLAVRAAADAAGGYFFANDFYPIWLTSRECVWRHIDPYSPEITRSIQRGLVGRSLLSPRPGDPASDYRTLPYPAFVDLYGLPVSWLPFPAARIVVGFVFLFLIAVSVFLWAKTLGWNLETPQLLVFVILTWFSYQGLEGMFAEQIGVLSVFLLAMTAASLIDGKLVRSGCCLALATVKPQMCALLIFYLMVWALAEWKRRRRFVISFLATEAWLCLLAMLVWPNWIASWIHSLLTYGDYSRPPLPCALFGFYPGVIVIVALLAASAVLAWRRRKASPSTPEFAAAVALLLAVTAVTLLPEHAVYDHLILLPGIMLAMQSRRQIASGSAVSRGVAALAVAVIAWPWLAAPVVLAMKVAAPASAAAILFLPVRTAAAIPFVVLALLFITIRNAQSPAQATAATA
ncbi:MAG TPA: glycosyltransferase family 87 protein [Terriglobales bacterium]|nr:glycosyltransferase family 87 protein [Terriglobales bacterium]